jgi:hypothetical protein
MPGVQPRKTGAACRAGISSFRTNEKFAKSRQIRELQKLRSAEVEVWPRSGRAIDGGALRRDHTTRCMPFRRLARARRRETGQFRLRRDRLITFVSVSLEPGAGRRSAFVFFAGMKRNPFGGHSTGETLFNHAHLVQAARGDWSRFSGGGQERNKGDKRQSRLAPRAAARKAKDAGLTPIPDPFSERELARCGHNVFAPEGGEHTTTVAVYRG